MFKLITRMSNHFTTLLIIFMNVLHNDFDLTKLFSDLYLYSIS